MSLGITIQVVATSQYFIAFHYHVIVLSSIFQSQLYVGPVSTSGLASFVSYSCLQIVGYFFGSQIVAENKYQLISWFLVRYTNWVLVIGRQSDKENRCCPGSFSGNVCSENCSQFNFWTLKMFNLLIVYLIFILIMKEH